jgi:hypothetical protein
VRERERELYSCSQVTGLCRAFVGFGISLSVSTESLSIVYAGSPGPAGPEGPKGGFGPQGEKR